MAARIDSEDASRQTHDAAAVDECGDPLDLMLCSGPRTIATSSSHGSIDDASSPSPAPAAPQQECLSSHAIPCVVNTGGGFLVGTTPAVGAAASASPGGASSSNATIPQVEAQEEEARGIADHLSTLFSSTALQALLKCVSSTSKPPLPKYIAILLDVSHRRDEQRHLSDSTRGQNNWLVTQLHKKLLAARELHVIAKVMMITHDLLTYGAPEFVAALAPVQESYFDSESKLKSLPRSDSLPQGSRSEHDSQAEPDTYEQATRFFMAYVHAVLEFQMRHRSEGNLLDPQSKDLLLRIADDDTWNPQLRDIALSCVSLTKFLVTANTAMPCYCFVFAEIMRRYVSNARRLYHILSRVIHIIVVSKKREGLVAIDEVRKNIQCISNYTRVTTQLNDFFDALRSLPEEAVFERDLIPEPLRQVPPAVLEHLQQRLQKLQEIDSLEVESLESVLSKNNSSIRTASDMQLPSTVAEQPMSAVGEKGADGAAVARLVNPLPKSKVSNVTIIASQLPNDASEAPADGDELDSSSSTGGGVSGLRSDGRDAYEDSLVTAQSFFMEGMAAGSQDDDIILRNRRIDANRFDEEDEDTISKAINSNDSSDPSLPTMIISERGTTHDISRFHVLEDQILGKGGFGVVYKAWDEEEGRHVACKEVKLSQDKAGLQELFKEYRVLTTLQHPNIVNVLGFVVKGGHGRIFMEWVPSGSVQAVLQEKKSGLRETIVRRYIREALEGLAYLHSRGIVHRDMKPGNMLLSADGTVKLTDFGTSRTLEHAAETMQTGTVVGTVPYLAPECVRGTYSAASDVWAVGCAAIHMFTGRAPWADETHDNIGVIFKIGNLTEADHIPRAVRESSEMSDSLRSFIEAALTFDRHERPSTDELLSHLFVAEQS